jgi:A/G-specific adenine glycosylase
MNMKSAKPTGLKNQFSTLLLKWNIEHNDRKMPWKGEKDPYKIWLSEIILQQTRVDQGRDYYNRFVSEFPDIQSLANASDERIFKLWEGLGYYTRCRNLLATAKHIAYELNGQFPRTYHDILSLKGIGSYTASAIVSFAFNLPHAVVDGNVYRVLARIFGIDTAVDSTEGKKQFTLLANELIDRDKPGLYNQSIMDFGAVVCKPQVPLCENCIFSKNCFAYQHGKVNSLPVKGKRPAVRKRWFYYLQLEFGNEVYIRKRVEKDIWQQLFEFVLLETGAPVETEDILQQAENMSLVQENGYELVTVSPVFRQQLTHQHITGQFIRVRLKKKMKAVNGGVWIKKDQLPSYAFPQFINQHMKNEILA